MEYRRVNYLNGEEPFSAQEPEAPAPAPEGEPKNKKDKQKKYKLSNLLVGFLVLALACYGLFRLGTLTVGFFKEKTKSRNAAESVNLYQYLIPAAAIDVEPFEDVTTAKMSELVELTVWGVLNSGLDSTQYDFDGDALLLPEAQVAAAFINYFGTERAVEHQTVSGYGYQFTYDAAAHCYKIPLTTITPIYTPKITETQTKGDSTVLKVGYLNAGMYAQNQQTGELTAPEPDKYVQITLRSASTGMYISSVRSLGIPETAWANIPDATSAPLPGEPESFSLPADEDGEASAPAEDGETSPSTETP